MPNEEFPDTDGLPVGDIIRACWNEEFEAAADVRLVGCFGGGGARLKTGACWKRSRAGVTRLGKWHLVAMVQYMHMRGRGSSAWQKSPLI
jgi:hypothetical protein